MQLLRLKMLVCELLAKFLSTQTVNFASIDAGTFRVRVGQFVNIWGALPPRPLDSPLQLCIQIIGRTWRHSDVTREARG